MAMRLEQSLELLDEARRRVARANEEYEAYIKVKTKGKSRTLILSSPWSEGGSINEDDEWIRVEPDSLLHDKLYRAGLEAVASMMLHAYTVMDEAVKNYNEAREASRGQLEAALLDQKLETKETK